MSITEVREILGQLREQIDEGARDQALSTLERAQRSLDSRQLLTTSEAAQWLRIGSVNTLKLLVHRCGIQYEKHGNRMMIPLSEVERLQDEHLAQVQGIRASDRIHEETADLGATEGLTAEQMDDLETARPGRLPWARERELVGARR